MIFGRWCFALAILASLAFPALSAERALTEEEEAAREEALLQAQGKIPETGHEKVLEGKYLVTVVEGGEKAAIPGVFVVKGHVYQLKLANEELRGRLKPFNGKRVTLGGKIRNQGKYFILEEVLTQPGGAYVPAQAHTAPGRL